VRTVKVLLDRDQAIGVTDRRLFGAFVEHLGRCVYDGIFEPGHPAADKRGFRRDVLALIRELAPTIVRYPGGNFVSGYDWEDGVGPRERRPKRLDLAWLSTENQRVRHRRVHRLVPGAEVEPMLAVNLGTRGPDAARNLVEYCNIRAAPRCPTGAARMVGSSRTVSSSGVWATRWTAPGRSARRRQPNTAASPPRRPS
jgi:alpha-N-arabinofuranosidase